MSMKARTHFFLLMICFAIWSCDSPLPASKNFNKPYSKATIGLLEIIGKVDSDELIKVCTQNNISSSSIYNWNDHIVIYEHWPPIQSALIAALKKKFSGCEFKPYYSPFYTFDKSVRCADTAIAKEWTNIILTANLVADPKKQQEYLDYHKNQFEKWPEVSNGFCNANFQQLLVFKNGRQLMLVISIPKGKTLDELNPLTSKNNPRADEWNKIMSKYQEGIPGTKKGETWVFLRPLAESGSPKDRKSESKK